MQQAVRDALIAFMAATAQAQAEATKAAQRAGIEHAKAKDGAAYLGRKPSYSRQQFTMVRQMLGHDAVDFLSEIYRKAAVRYVLMAEDAERPDPVRGSGSRDGVSLWDRAEQLLAETR